jgi:hypothetical protein
MASVSVVRRYEDMRDVVEREISRLLRCDPHRRPAFLESRSFWSFKSGVLDLLDGKGGRIVCYLPQGLVAEACVDAACCCVSVSFKWRHAGVECMEEGLLAGGTRKRKMG